MRRRLVNKKEWKEFYPVRRFYIPVIFISGVFMHLLGNWDIVFLIYHFIIGTLLVILYTKKTEEVEEKRKRNQVEKKKGLTRVVRIIVEVVMVIVLTFQLYDTFRYTVAVAQIQFNNEGYVRVVSVKSGEGDSRGIYANEYNKKDKKVYQHLFRGYKYLSRVDITDEIIREMKERDSKSRVGVENGGSSN